MRGGHLLKHWSSTQQIVALSSGEAELKGIVKGAAEGMGMQSTAKELSIHYDIHWYTDSSAAMGMVARKGMGESSTHRSERTMDPRCCEEQCTNGE